MKLEVIKQGKMEITIKIPDKQIQILRLLEEGLSQKEIAHKTGIELTRVKTNIYSLCQQLNCKNSVQLVCTAIRMAII